MLRKMYTVCVYTKFLNLEKGKQQTMNSGSLWDSEKGMKDFHFLH